MLRFPSCLALLLAFSLLGAAASACAAEDKPKPEPKPADQEKAEPQRQPEEKPGKDEAPAPKAPPEKPGESRPPERAPNWDEGRGRAEEVKPGTETAPRATTEREVLNQLDRRITVDYVETELQDIVRDLAAQSGINMVIGADVEKAKKITLQVKDMPVCRVLAWVMELSGYHAIYKNEAVLITAKTESKLITMVYPIADLLRPAKSYYPPGEEGDDEEEDPGDSAEKLLELIRKITESENK